MKNQTKGLDQVAECLFVRLGLNLSHHKGQKLILICHLQYMFNIMWLLLSGAI